MSAGKHTPGLFARVRRWFACKHHWVWPRRDVYGDVGPAGAIVFVCCSCGEVVP